MSQRYEFAILAGEPGLSFKELCRRFGISRKTGYKWLRRFDAGGRRALTDRSRAPHRCPHRIAPATAELICAARRAHPMCGRQVLAQRCASG